MLNHVARLPVIAATSASVRGWREPAADEHCDDPSPAAWSEITYVRDTRNGAAACEKAAGSKGIRGTKPAATDSTKRHAGNTTLALAMRFPAMSRQTHLRHRRSLTWRRAIRSCVMMSRVPR